MKNQWDFIPDLMKPFTLCFFRSKCVLTVLVTAWLSFTSSLVTPTFTGQLILKNLNEPECYNFFPKVLHLVNYFAKQFFIWNRSWLCKTDKSYCSKWYDSYQASQCNKMLLAWIKGTFNGEEGLGHKSSLKSIMYRIIGYIRFRHTFI